VECSVLFEVRTEFFNTWITLGSEPLYEVVSAFDWTTMKHQYKMYMHSILQYTYFLTALYSVLRKVIGLDIIYTNVMLQS
jgi:hypothetical protein